MSNEKGNDRDEQQKALSELFDRYILPRLKSGDTEMSYKNIQWEQFEIEIPEGLHDVFLISSYEDTTPRVIPVSETSEKMRRKWIHLGRYLGPKKEIIPAGTGVFVERNTEMSNYREIRKRVAEFNTALFLLEEAMEKKNTEAEKEIREGIQLLGGVLIGDLWGTGLVPRPDVYFGRENFGGDFVQSYVEAAAKLDPSKIKVIPEKKK